MENTMADLREEVASRLRNSLHGREFDKNQMQDITLFHMLGVTPVGKIHDPSNEEMTLVDPNHAFWEDYYEDVSTKSEVHEKIETAVKSLQEDGVFRMLYPYGEDWGDVVYIEVDQLSSSDTLMAECAGCGAPIEAVEELGHEAGHYFFVISLDCDECGFSRSLERSLIRR